MTKRHSGTGANSKYNNHKNRSQAVKILATDHGSEETKLKSKITSILLNLTENSKKFTQIATQMAVKYFWIAYSAVASNYLPLVFILGVYLLSLLLPDISQKLQKNSELKAIKSCVHRVTDEVNRAEVACLTATEEMCFLQNLCDEGTETSQELRNLSVCTSRGLLATQSEPVQVEKKVGFLRRFFALNRNVSKKEIAIMSIVYTDSFDSQKKVDVAAFNTGSKISALC